MDLELLRRLQRPADTKIVLLVMDGLGGLPGPDGLTELEAASTPNLDALAYDAACGLHVPVGGGIAPGSGPAHLALFGYDPIRYQVGRGTLSALGVGFPLGPTDVAARGNFCTVDDSGILTDRRAGRISTELAAELCRHLAENIRLPGVELFVQAEKDYRFLLVLRGANLSDAVTETDPQSEGEAPLESQALSADGAATALAVNTFAREARRLLADRHPANMVLLRGFAKRPDWPRFGDVFGVRAAAIAGYPMYRGVARLVGMDALEAADDIGAELDVLAAHWADHDFFFVHVKRVDSAGEDGDFARKVGLIEEVDRLVPRISALGPDVIVVTGDHSTPSTLRRHSAHPVPVLLWSSRGRPDRVARFGERDCMAGALGPQFPAKELMPLAMAEAGRLDKFGA